MRRHLKYLRVGVGGRNCPCCFPPPGKRKTKFRAAKRKEHRDAFKCEELNGVVTELVDVDDSKSSE